MSADRLAEARDEVIRAANQYIDDWLADESAFLPPSYAPLRPLFDAVLRLRAIESETTEDRHG